MNQIQEDVNRQARSLGIEIVDVRLTRVDLPAAEQPGGLPAHADRASARGGGYPRQRRSSRPQTHPGQGRPRRDGASRAEANRQAEELRGQGDAEKNRILAEAFGQDPDFFAFYRSMQAYEAGLKSGRHAHGVEPELGLLPLLQRSAGPSPAGTAARTAAATRRPEPPARGAISLMLDLVAALGLALAVEGILFAAFPEGMRRAMMRRRTAPSDGMRVVGIVSRRARCRDRVG